MGSFSSIEFSSWNTALMRSCPNFHLGSCWERHSGQAWGFPTWHRHSPSSLTFSHTLPTLPCPGKHPSTSPTVLTAWHRWAPLPGQEPGPGVAFKVRVVLIVIVIAIKRAPPQPAAHCQAIIHPKDGKWASLSSSQSNHLHTHRDGVCSSSQSPSRG